MKSLTKIQATRIAALLMLAVLVCIGAQAAVAEENTLIISKGIAEPSDLDFGIDPTISNDVREENGWQYRHYFTHCSPLIDTDTYGNIIPWMAESYEVSDDHKAITFHLRKGVKFADGTPFNASVAKFNFDRIYGYGWKDERRKNFAPIKYYHSSEALDDYTFRVQFTYGWLTIARDLTGSQFAGYISPWDVDPAWDIKGVLKPEKIYNGLGPYYVDENESIPKEKIILKRRPCWRDDLNFHVPKINKLVLTLIANPQTAVMALENGEINFISRYNSPPLESLLKLEMNPDIAIKSRPSFSTYFITTSYWKEPFNGSDGMLLRKAISCAIDREEIAKGAFFGYATPATDTMYLSPMWPNVPECCHKGYDYDLDKAKKLLAEAGWNDTDGDGILDKNGKSLKDLNLVITSASNSNWMKDVALMIQSQLNRVGIEAKIHTLESSVYGEAIRNGDFDLILDSTSSAQLRRFNSSMVRGTYPIYANENNTLQDIIYKAEMAMHEDEQADYFCRACDILYEDAGTIPLVHPMDYAVMSSKVKGYEFGIASYKEPYEECWIE